VALREKRLGSKREEREGADERKRRVWEYPLCQCRVRRIRFYNRGVGERGGDGG